MTDTSSSITIETIKQAIVYGAEQTTLLNTKYVKMCGMVQKITPESKYVMVCGRPSWFKNLRQHTEFTADSHGSAMVKMYDYFLKYVQWGDGTPVDLYDYSLKVMGIDLTSVVDMTSTNIAMEIIGFYFGYAGVYDCGLYVLNEKDLGNNEMIFNRHQFIN